MTEDASLKKAIRARMAQTGEKYTQARRAVLAETRPGNLAGIDTPGDPARPSTAADPVAQSKTAVGSPSDDEWSDDEWLLAIRHELLEEDKFLETSHLSEMARMARMGRLVGPANVGLQDRIRERERLATLRRRVLGDQHPRSFAVVNDLALELLGERDYVGARTLQEALLDFRRRTLGEEHHDTLAAMSDLAATTRAQGAYSEARALLESLVDIRNRQFGSEHEHTVTAMSDLGAMLLVLGDTRGAQELQQKVLDFRRRTLGEEHHDTLAAMSDLAASLLACGDRDRANQMIERLWAPDQQNAKPDALMGNVTSLLQAVGEQRHDREVQEEILEKSMARVGEEDSSTLLSMRIVAEQLWDASDYEGARKLQEQMLDVYQRVYGKDAFQTVTAMSELAKTLKKQGEFARADELLEYVERETEMDRVALSRGEPIPINLRGRSGPDSAG